MKRFFLVLSSVLIVSFGISSFTYDGFEISKQIEIFVSFYQKLNQNYVDETNPAELMDVAIQAITKELDPYTRFWTEQDIINSKIRNSGEYTGIGAAVFVKNKRLFISEPYKGFPADKSGLKAGDEIIKIDNITVAKYEGAPEDLLKGASGSKVVLTYLREEKKQITSVNRSLIDVDAVPFYKLLSDNTGYIVLQKFNEKASTETIAALKELKARGADKIILDLRSNPGGLLTEAVNVCNIFIPKGQLIVHTESAVKSNQKVYKTKKDPIDIEIPLVVLINDRSASASEIVSGVIQDLDRGVIIGARSYGKGLVQSVKTLKYDTRLKVTTSRYFIPSGRCIQALDYWHKNENNLPTRTQKSDYKAFKTLNSERTVYDGGGINPDIIIDVSKRSRIASALLREKMIFNFATEYYHSHEFNNLNEFNFSDKNYDQFLSFLKKHKFDYKPKTEKLLDDLLLVAEKELLQKTIKEFKELKTNLNLEKKELLKIQKKELKQLVQNEILKRFFYREGMYEYNTLISEEVSEAQIVLLDKARYISILGKDK